MTKKKQATKAPKAIDPRDVIIADLKNKIDVLIGRLMYLEQNEKAACATPRPNLSVGLAVNETTLIVDNAGRAWWINPGLQEIRQA